MSVYHQRIRRIASAAIALFLVNCLAPVALLGATVLSPLLAQETQSNITTRSTRPLYLEVGIVVLLFGAALFAVCRSSRRS